jgi:hypothetical protein
MTASKTSLLGILADPKNRAVAGKFFRFSFMLILGPLGFLFVSTRMKLLSIDTSAIFAVILTNLIMGVYAWEAYREEVRDYRENSGITHANHIKDTSKKYN